MLKKILAIVAMLYAAASFAAVDVNKASAADLDGVKGIGPSTSKSIVDERKKHGDFKSWEDFISRVKGIGETKATNLSKEGLTVGGAEYKKAAATKKDEKPAAKTEKKDEKAAATTEKKDDKAAAKTEKAPATTEKKDDKTASAAKPAPAPVAAPAASATKK